MDQSRQPGGQLYRNECNFICTRNGGSKDGKSRIRHVNVKGDLKITFDGIVVFRSDGKLCLRVCCQIGSSGQGAVTSTTKLN